jgi:hypothetical protein
MTINIITERPIEEAVQSELQQFEAASREMLGLDSSVTEPDDVIRVINQHIDTLGKPHREQATEQRILLLACLWGIQICRRLKWEWVELTIDGENYYGIVSPAREYAILPFVYMRQVLTDQDRDNTALLIYNMLKMGTFTPSEAGSYYVLE